MAKSLPKYTIQERFMSGDEDRWYSAINLETLAIEKFTRDQLILLIGRGQVTNITATFNGDKVILHGFLMPSKDMPVKLDEANTENIDIPESKSHIDRDTIKDLRLPGPVDTVHGFIRSIPVEDNLEPGDYQNYRDAIDNINRALAFSYAKHNIHYENGIEGRFIKPKVRVAKMPDTGDIVIGMDFVIFYKSDLNLPNKTATCNMMFNLNKNKSTCSIQIPKYGDSGEMKLTKLMGESSSTAIEEFWTRLIREVVTLKMHGFDTTRGCGKSSRKFFG